MEANVENRIRIGFDPNLAELRALLPEAVRLLEEGFDSDTYGFVYITSSSQRTVVVHRMEASHFLQDRGIVLRLVHHGKNFETATNALDRKSIFASIERLRSLARRDKAEKGRYPFYTPVAWKDEPLATLDPEIANQLPESPDASTQVHFSPLVSSNPLSVDAKDLAARARELREGIIARDREYCSGTGSEPLANVMVTLKVIVETHVFTDRCRNMSQTLPIVLAIANTQTAKGKTGRTTIGGLGGFETLAFRDTDFRRTVDVPHILDAALLLEPGNYTVITGPSVTGIFAHEAFGHTMEADTVRQGRSIYGQLKPKKTGNEHATIVNNPAIFSMADVPYGPNGSYFFDHEGELAREQVILDHGELKNPMTDLLSSIHLGIRRSANGKRESWRRPTLSRQTNTYFTAGDRTLDELISLVKGRGFLATEPHGGMEDPKGARLTAGTEFLEEIMDGRLTGRYFLGPKGGHVELAGYVPDLLSGIIAKSKLEYTQGIKAVSRFPINKSGGCGKFHKELVRAGAGGPYILWSSITCG